MGSAVRSRGLVVVIVGQYMPRLGRPAASHEQVTGTRFSRTVLSSPIPGPRSLFHAPSTDRTHHRPREARPRRRTSTHRPRVLLGKMGLDGHDRGVKLIARALRDSGIHVIYSGLWQTPRSLAISARDEDADCIACSMMSNSHLVLVPAAPRGVPEASADRTWWSTSAGSFPRRTSQTLLEAGVNRVYHTGNHHGGDRRAVSASRPGRTRRSRAIIRPRALARSISFAHAGVRRPKRRAVGPRRSSA